MNFINHDFQSRTDTRACIEALCDALRTPGDTNSIKFACEAADSDRAAFWVRTKFSNTASSLCTDCANQTGDLETAFAITKFPSGIWSVYQQLEVLIPLNRQAAEQMVEQYSLLGHMRDVEELLARETFIIIAGYKTRAN
ncbi:hypothetical protein [Phyllobacterium zundukense]|nr:hypothetical protein [Phyllobacterium zundukense]